LQARLLTEVAPKAERQSFSLSAEAFDAARELTERAIADLSAGPPLPPQMRFGYRRYWTRLNRAAGIALDYRASQGR